MNMVVFLWCERELTAYDLRLQDVRELIELVKRYGFEDDDGETYKFHSAHLEAAGMMVLLDKESEWAMKKRISILACLVFFSLACLSTAAQFPQDTAAPVQTATVLQVVKKTSLARVDVSPMATTSPKLCAVVIAETAVHLRKSADPAGTILDHLGNGEELQLLGDVGGDWWHVKRGELVGYVRAVYLREEVCQWNFGKQLQPMDVFFIIYRAALVKRILPRENTLVRAFLFQWEKRLLRTL
jgi:hypothetical protein